MLLFPMKYKEIPLKTSKLIRLVEILLPVLKLKLIQLFVWDNSGNLALKSKPIKYETTPKMG